jgi:hypothetical protein
LVPSGRELSILRGRLFRAVDDDLLYLGFAVFKLEAERLYGGEDR